MCQMSAIDMDMYEFGGLNDNKKITATFAHYEVNNHHGELYITAVLIIQRKDYSHILFLDTVRLIISLWDFLEYI